MQVCEVNCRSEDALLGLQAQAEDLDGFVEAVFSRKLAPERARHSTFVIKPNLGFMTDSRGGTTSPRLLEAVLSTVVGQYDPADVLVVETDGIAFRCEEVFDYLGLPGLVAKYGARLLNLSKEPYTVRRFDHNLLLKEVRYPDCLQNGEAVLIDLAKVKMHEIARYSGAIKNLFGLNPYVFKLEYHRKIDQALADVYRVFPTQITIVDGLWSINGHGPWTGESVYTGFLVGCADSLLADLVALRQIGLDVESVPYLDRLAREYKSDVPEDCPRAEAGADFQWVDASRAARMKERAACAAIPLFKRGFPLVFPSQGGWKVVRYGNGGRYCRSIHQYGTGTASGAGE
jgi:uncharacterized protein (DUF362 family)